MREWAQPTSEEGMAWPRRGVVCLRLPMAQGARAQRGGVVELSWLLPLSLFVEPGPLPWEVLPFQLSLSGNMLEDTQNGTHRGPSVF